MTGWARRLREVDVDVACGGGVHTVRLRRGRLALCDHDAAGEAALMALGGDAPACVAVLRAWRRATATRVDDLPPALADARRWTLCRTAERARASGTTGSGSYLERRTRDVVLDALERWAATAGESARQPLTFTCRIDWAPAGSAPGDVMVGRAAGNLVVAVTVPATWWRDVGVRGPLADGGRLFRLDRELGLRWRDGRPLVVPT